MGGAVAGGRRFGVCTIAPEHQSHEAARTRDGSLRYPKQVRGAMRDLPDLDKLSAQLGY